MGCVNVRGGKGSWFGADIGQQLLLGQRLAWVSSYIMHCMGAVVMGGNCVRQHLASRLLIVSFFCVLCCVMVFHDLPTRTDVFSFVHGHQSKSHACALLLCTQITTHSTQSATMPVANEQQNKQKA